MSELFPTNNSHGSHGLLLFIIGPRWFLLVTIHPAAAENVQEAAGMMPPQQAQLLDLDFRWLVVVIC